MTSPKLLLFRNLTLIYYIMVGFQEYHDYITLSLIYYINQTALIPLHFNKFDPNKPLSDLIVPP